MADRAVPAAICAQIWKDAAWLRLWAALDSAWGGIAPAGRPAEPLVRRGEPGEVLVTAAAARRSAGGRRGPPRPGPAAGARAGRPVLPGPRHAARWWPYHRPGLDQAAGHGLRGWAFRHRALDPARMTSG